MGLIRSGFRSTAVVLLSIVSFALSALPARASDGDLAIATPVVKPDQYDSLGVLTGAQLGAMVESVLGASRYQQVTTILSTCHSGAGLAPLAGQLKGAYNLIASCGANQTTSITQDKKTKAVTGVVPDLFQAITADPKIKVDDALNQGAQADPRVPKGSTPAQRAAWEADQKARYEAYVERSRTSAKDQLDQAIAAKKPADVVAALRKRLQSAQALPAWDKGGRDLRVQDPASAQSAGDPKPGQKAIAAGSKSNHAIIYQAYAPAADSDDSVLAATARKALQKAGYTSVDVLSPLTRDDYSALAKQADEGKPLSVPEDRATPGNLKKKLEALAAGFNEDEALTIVVISHGSLSLASDRTQGAIGAGQGSVFAAGALAGDHLGDPFTATLLTEEAHSTALGEALVDYPFFRRWAQPTLAIQTLDEADPSGLPASVLLNGLVLGSLALHDGAAGYYELPLSDAFIDALVTGIDLSAGLDLTFSFGGTGDYFRLATADDLIGLDGGFGRYGISLTAHLDGGTDIPEPGALSLVALAATLSVVVRRRARQQRAAAG